VPKALREAVYQRDGYSCIYCGSQERLSLDHLTPEIRGGTHDIENLGTACLSCNGAKRDMTETEYRVSVTLLKRPQSTDNRTETNSEAKASGAEAPDHRSDLFGRGLKTLAQITGKGPDACRSFVGKCLKEAKDDAVTVLGLIDDAERNRVADPSGWIAARLKAKEAPSLAPTKDDEWRTYLNNFKKFGRWRPGIGNEPGMPSCRAPAHLLREFGYNEVTSQ